MVSKSMLREKRKTRKTTSGKRKYHYDKKKTANLDCAICSAKLSGVFHGKSRTEMGKLSKTKRMPSALFGGILCSKCRTMVIEEAIKVKTGIKKKGKTALSDRKFIEIAVKSIE